MAKKSNAGSKVQPSLVPAGIHAELTLSEASAESIALGDALVKVGVANARKELRRVLDEWKDYRESLQEQMKEQEDKLQKLVDKAAAQFGTKLQKAWKQFLTAVADTGKVKSTGGRYDEGSNTEKSYVLVTATCIADSHGSFFVKKRIPVTTTIQRAVDAKAKLYEQIADATTRMVELQRQLAALPQYKEDLEARIAELQLQKHATSNQLLKQIRQDFSRQVKALAPPTK